MQHSQLFTDQKKETSIEKPHKEETKGNQEDKRESSPEQKKQLDKLPEAQPESKSTQNLKDALADEQGNMISKQSEQSNTVVLT